MLVGNEPLYGTTVNHCASSSDKSKIPPISAACSLFNVICPKHAAVTHSLLKLACFATSAHLTPLATLAAKIFVVTSARFIRISLNCESGWGRGRVIGLHVA